MERDEAERIIGAQKDRAENIPNSRVLNGISGGYSAEQVEEALNVLAESGTDCAMDNGVQMFFWLPSKEQKYFLGQLGGGEIVSQFITYIILWCTRYRKIRITEHEFNKIIGEPFNMKFSKKEDELMGILLGLDDMEITRLLIKRLMLQRRRKRM